MRKTSRFLYLNTYSFLLLACGIAIAIVPLYRISMVLVIPQAILFIYIIKQTVRIFSTWGEKKRSYAILMERNRNSFRPDTFKAYMQAPCGRLLTRVVLDDLNQKDKYRSLLAYRDPLLVSLKKGCTTQKAAIYINEKYRPQS